MAGLAKMFWSESFWLTPDLSWEDFENKQGSEMYIPQATDMLWSIPLALLLLVFRYFFERYLVTPIAEWAGLKDRKQPHLKPNPVLEDLYLQNGITSNNNLESVAKKTDLSVRQVERWLRNRQSLSKPGKLQKFRECSWYFLFYICIFSYGLHTLWDKPWLWDTSNCWKNWPKLHVSQDIYHYYLLELSFYWSLVFSVLTDIRRKDFKEMMVHHAATVVLVSFSWASNFVRIGSLVLLCHDAADFPLAFGKMCKYLGLNFLCEVVFGLFIVIWICSRLIFFPKVILYSTMFEVYELISVPTSVVCFNMLLIVLQVLHLIWSYMIAKVVFQMLYKGKVVNDVRSESESG